MALACNIDERGRAYRYRIGFVLVALGVLLGILSWQLVSGWLALLLGGLVTAGGLFSLFEARNSWCAARALGFKTRV